MGRQPKEALRALTAEEKEDLQRISRAHSAPAESVTRAKLILAVAAGKSYTEAAKQVGRKSNDAVAALVRRFNREGIDALIRRHGGGFPTQYGEAEKARILREFEREPDLERDGTAQWTLSTLQRALRSAAGGLPNVSTEKIYRVLHEAGYRWQRDRSWSKTGEVVRKRKAGLVVITDPDAEAKKK